MKRIYPFLLMALAVMLLASCASTVVDYEEPVPEPVQEVVEPEVTAPEETEPEVIDEEASVAIDKGLLIQETPAYSIGDLGPNGGLVFECDGQFFEIHEPFYEVKSYEDAIACCEALASETGVPYHLPSIKELEAIYEQLMLSGLAEDVDWTYYWSIDQADEGSAYIMNFDTGFTGVFYKSMDFISVLPTVAIY